MSKKDMKIVEVKLEADIYEDVAAYCAFFGIDHERFLNEITKTVITEKLNIVDTLREGYLEMAHINLEICREFEACEKEVSVQF